MHVMASSWPATAYMLHRKDAPALLREPVVLDVAKATGRKPAQVLIRWALQMGCSVSPKAASHDHIKVVTSVGHSCSICSATYRYLNAVQGKLPCGQGVLGPQAQSCVAHDTCFEERLVGSQRGGGSTSAPCQDPSHRAPLVPEITRVCMHALADLDVWMLIVACDPLHMAHAALLPAT